jgi:hypothetical protein
MHDGHYRPRKQSILVYVLLSLREVVPPTGSGGRGTIIGTTIMVELKMADGKGVGAGATVPRSLIYMKRRPPGLHAMPTIGASFHVR